MIRLSVNPIDFCLHTKKWPRVSRFWKIWFLNNGESIKSLQQQITGPLVTKDCIEHVRLSQESLVEIHFFFLNVVDFFQRIFCLDSKQLLGALTVLKNLCSSAVFLVQPLEKLQSIHFMCFFKK